ncbi:MAG TPA: transglycosylase domain-containing protein [Gaiellaceae bacterium]|nr:transglycosylase domain-containing protein [Gaiellaceae bacterium]HEX2496570.1 transglycosylase domain-containing protein [Gaiellaceae bacterium]
MSPYERSRRRREARRGLEEDAYRRRTRRQRRRVKSRGRRRIALLVALVALVLAGIGAAGITGAATIGPRCDLDRLRPVEIGQNSFVYAADGSLLGSIPAEKNRQPVKLNRVSKWMRLATIAIEDRRFYDHSGIDLEGIARALSADIRAGKVVEGGSTLTQQLVRNLYVGNEVTFERKAIEACLAVRLNNRRSKDWILESYLNTVFYGSRAYGVHAAAQTYFSRPAWKLGLGESALLAGLTQAPSVYDPFSNPRAALARRDQVLAAMVEQGKITRRQYRQAVSQRDLRLRPGRLYTRIREPYFFSYVRPLLVAQYGANTVRSGGLRVYTTVDRRFQQQARNAILRTLPYSNDPAAAIVAINPSNGAIRAMTAVTPGKRGNQFNLASQGRRQAGSTFKTFVLTAAVAEGVDPDSTSYTSAPFRYQPDPLSEPWEVQTYSHEYIGSTSISNATLSSDNTVYAQLTLDLGPDKVAAMAHRLGVRSSLRTREGVHVPSLGLGSAAVSPLDMASAYATLAAGGIYSEPMAIRKVILPDGTEDKDAGWGKPRRKRAVADWVADEVTQILEDNIDEGTGTNAGVFFSRPAAGKTGTTDEHTDAWFCGYTPNLSTTVWVGYPQGQIPMENVHGIQVAGGTFPTIIWNLFMRSAIGSTPEVDFPEPRSEPTWVPFSRGQYANDSYYDYDEEDSDSDSGYDE